MHPVRRLFSLVIALLVAGVAMSTTQVAATPRVSNGVYIFNTTYSTNLGLGYCTPTSDRGCIESISVGGVTLQQVATPTAASFYVGGGVYYLPCRFVATSSTSCEAPYLSITRLDGTALTDVEVLFRRKPGTDPTARIGAAVLSGSLTSFEPAAPGVRDVATIRMSAVETHHYQQGADGCRGWVVAIDACVIGYNATSKSINNVGLLLLPGMRSAVVPPDVIDPTCSTLNPTGNCIVNVFEDASIGGWVDTSASVFGLASTDRFTGAAQLKVAGPHFKAAATPGGAASTELNLATFRTFLPTEFLRLSFGLAPSQANATTLPVRRTLGTSSTAPATVYSVVEGGLRVDTTGIGFSVPTVTMQRVLVVKRGKKVTASSILAAAGVSQSKRFGSAKITLTKGSGMMKKGSRYVFSKARTVKVTVTYRATKKTTAKRILTVKVSK